MQKSVFFSSVVVVLQQVQQDLTFLQQLLCIGNDPKLSGFLQVGKLILVGDKRIKFGRLPVAGTGKLGTVKAKFHFVALKTASGDGTGLVAISAAAARTIISKLHRAKGAVEATEGKQQVFTDKSFQGKTSLDKIF